MRYVLLACLLCLPGFSAAALELAGAKVAEQVQVADRQLVLNGAGIRSILFFRVYVGALYLGQRTQSAEAVLEDGGAKRVSLHVTAGEVGIERLVGGLRSGIEKNCTVQQLDALHERLAGFDALLGPVKKMKKGDVIDFDWLPGEATRVSLNGAELGRVAGGDFYRALLSVWLGGKPVDGDLKRGMLGHAP